jgi:hypothetical protein
VLGETKIRLPYGCFYSTTTQAIAVANSTQTITFDGAIDAHGISVCGTCISPSLSGEYQVHISIIADGNQNAMFYVYPRINWVDVPYSNTDKKFAANQTPDVIAVPYIFDLEAGDLLEFIMVGSSTSVEIVASVGLTTPVMPDIPSIIITINKLGEIQVD